MTETNNALDPFLEELGRLQLRDQEERARLREDYDKRSGFFEKLFKRLVTLRHDELRKVGGPSWWSNTISLEHTSNKPISKEDLRALSKHLDEEIRYAEMGRNFEAMMNAIKADENLEAIWDQLCMMAKMTEGDK